MLRSFGIANRIEYRILNNILNRNMSKSLTCENCECNKDENSKYPKDPNVLNNEKFQKSVGYHKHHIFFGLSSPNDSLWPGRIESLNGPRMKLMNHLIYSTDKSIKVTAFFDPQTNNDDIISIEDLELKPGTIGVESGRLFLFPSGIEIKYDTTTTTDYKEFTNRIIENLKLKESSSFLLENIRNIGKQLNLNEKQFSASLIDKNSIWFCCAHEKRDGRCGHYGKLNEICLKKELKNENASVYKCSHIGGHKYAGNVISCYKNPDNSYTLDWFGFISPGERIKNLLKDVSSESKSGISYSSFFRGRMS